MKVQAQCMLVMKYVSLKNKDSTFKPQSYNLNWSSGSIIAALHKIDLYTMFLDIMNYLNVCFFFVDIFWTYVVNKSLKKKSQC